MDVLRKKPDKYLALRNIIHAISEESKYTYGSPRIWITLRKRGIVVSEKVVRKLMKEEHVIVRYARKKKAIQVIKEKFPRHLKIMSKATLMQKNLTNCE